MNTLRNYYYALKPERTYANVMTTAAGFLFASSWHIGWVLLVATLLGTTFVVMSACAANNCTDRQLDARMPRTKRRATVTGDVPIRNLVVLAVVLGLAGFAVLALWTNWLVVALGIVGYIDYVVLYAWTKRTTPWSTLAGTISGGVPLMAGYVAVMDKIDATALLLGLVMVFWQMVHFYSIGIFRLKDYKAGGLPVWPVRHGVRSTQAWILVYVVLFLLSIEVLNAYGNMGVIFFWGMVLVGLYWFWLGAKGFKTEKPEKWARGMFGFSLLALLVLSAGIAAAPLLP